MPLLQDKDYIASVTLNTNEIPVPRTSTPKRAKSRIPATVTNSHSLSMSHRSPCPSPKRSYTVLYGTPKKVRLDHSYYSEKSEPCSSTELNSQSTACTLNSHVESAASAPEQIDNDTYVLSPVKSSHEETACDPDYVPDNVMDSDDSENDVSSDDETAGTAQELNDDCHYIVAGKCLNELFNYCGKCGARIISKTNSMKGSMVSCTMTCKRGCKYVWRSQKVQRHRSVGNLLIVGAAESSGLTYERLKSFGDAMNLQLLGRSSYQTIVNDHLYPVV